LPHAALHPPPLPPPFLVHRSATLRTPDQYRLNRRLRFHQRLCQALTQDFPELQHLVFNVRQCRRVRLIIPSQRFFDQPGGFGFQFGFQVGARVGHGCPPEWDAARVCPIFAPGVKCALRDS